MKLKKAHSLHKTGAADKKNKIADLNDLVLTIAGY
jgi:hypothetical protein